MRRGAELGCPGVKRPAFSEDRDTALYASHANVLIHLTVVSVVQQRLIFGQNQLDDKLTLSYYGIKNESTIYVVLKLLGGGVSQAALAYASVLHDWDGNMASRVFIRIIIEVTESPKFPNVQGLKLIRGKVVVITGMVDKDWYVGRVPGESAGAQPFGQVFPSRYIKIEKCVKKTSHCKVKSLTCRCQVFESGFSSSGTRTLSWDIRRHIWACF